MFYNYNKYTLKLYNTVMLLINIIPVKYDKIYYYIIQKIKIFHNKLYKTINEICYLKTYNRWLRTKVFG